MTIFSTWIGIQSHPAAGPGTFGVLVSLVGCGGEVAGLPRPDPGLGTLDGSGQALPNGWITLGQG